MNLSQRPEPPTISVVMCTYNGARYLPEQLASIARQSRLPSELIACDDCSDDETVSMLHAFAAQAPFPVRIFKNPDRLGSTRNFDQAIGLATGELIALSDQDDVWAPEKLERLSDILIRDASVGGVFSDAALIDDSARPIGMTLFQKHRFSVQKQRKFLDAPAAVLLKHDVVTGATLLFRAAMRPYCSPIPPSWVHDAWLAWMISLHSKLALTTAPLISYRIHAGQQLGISSEWRTQSAPLAETRRRHYARVAHQFEDLADHLLRSGWTERDDIIHRIRAKIAFLQKESMLSGSLVIRVLQMVGLFPLYLHYARGLGALRTDLLLGRETS
jgi:hypothetical protein